MTKQDTNHKDKSRNVLKNVWIALPFINSPRKKIKPTIVLRRKKDCRSHHTMYKMCMRQSKLPSKLRSVNISTCHGMLSGKFWHSVTNFKHLLNSSNAWRQMPWRNQAKESHSNINRRYGNVWLWFKTKVKLLRLKKNYLKTLQGKTG